MKHLIAERQLIPPEAADLEASAVPTLRAMTAYYMARIVQNVGHRARIQGSDLFDHHHYSSAVCADLIVSDDRVSQMARWMFASLTVKWVLLLIAAFVVVAVLLFRVLGPWE